MPQPIRSNSPAAPIAVPRQRSPSRLSSPRQVREQDWATLVQTYMLLSRLVIERAKHHLPDDADTLARQSVLVEEQLSRCCPIRWPRLHARLLLEETGWWAEDHGDDLLSCQACRLQNGMASERIDVPPPPAGAIPCSARAVPAPQNSRQGSRKALRTCSARFTPSR